MFTVAILPMLCDCRCNNQRRQRKAASVQAEALAAAAAKQILPDMNYRLPVCLGWYAMELCFAEQRGQRKVTTLGAETAAAES